MGQVAEQDALVLREMRPSELAFVKDSWIRSYGKYVPHGVDGGLWLLGHRRVVSALLDRSTVLIAAHVETPHEIAGWICSQDPHYIHWVCVKHHLRGFGVASYLMDTVVGDRHLTATYKTRAGRRLLTHYPTVTYDPHGVALALIGDDDG